MRLFGSSLGCFTALSLDGSNSRGAQLQLPAGIYPSNSIYFPLIVTSVSGRQQEAVGFVKCFDDTNYMYAFGHNPAASQMTVNFTALLRGSCGSKNSIIAELSNAYKNSRVSQAPQLAKITLGGSSDVFKGYVTAMSTATKDAEHNLQDFSITLTLLDAQ